jgi:hypothetical protein
VVVVDKAEEKMPLLHAMALDASEKEDMCGVCVLCAQKSVGLFLLSLRQKKISTWKMSLSFFLFLFLSLSLSFSMIYLSSQSLFSSSESRC